MACSQQWRLDEDIASQSSESLCHTISELPGRPPYMGFGQLRNFHPVLFYPCFSHCQTLASDVPSATLISFI